ncbi:MAG: endonuclease/exonuclease/phosphatase family protein [Thermomicrobiales bacterium]
MLAQSNRARLIFEQGRETVRQARSPDTRSHPGDGFVAVSCNVGNGLADTGLLTDYLLRSNADVVGIQELSESQAAVIERDLSRAYPFRLLVPGGFAGKGVLSKLPIQNSGAIAFAPERPDLDATILIDDRALRVIVAHPRPPRISRSGLLFDPVTENQVRSVGELALRNSPAIVLCDLNTTSMQQAYLQLLAAGLIDPFRHAGRWAATFPVRVGNTHRFGSRADKWKLKPVLRIDYVLHTPELVASDANVGEDVGSDHLPVYAVLHWREAVSTGQ